MQQGESATSRGPAPATQFLSVVGCGVKGSSQITREALRELALSDLVLTISMPDRDAHDILELVGGVPFESVDDLYADGAVDAQNYQRIHDRIVATLAEHPRLCLLVYGHPRLGVTLIRGLEEHCATAGIGFAVIPGISSFDTMINDLERDPIERGSVILDANRLLLLRFQLEPTLDHYIYHVCSVGVANTNFRDPALGNRIDLLRDYLLQFFPASHVAELVASPVRAGGAARRIRCQIGVLEELLPDLSFESTLFIPGVRPNAIDRTFLTLLTGTPVVE